MALTSPDGVPITIRPIQPDEITRIPLRCWPEDTATLMQLFETQGTIGMAAWEGDHCVAQLHCYRVTLPHGDNSYWPSWNHWWKPEWWSRVVQEANLDLAGPAWCHACCHVGRSLETIREMISQGATGGAPGIRNGADSRYFGRGIGTALCRASLHWAWDHDYVATLALGAPQGLFEFAIAAGQLPWTTYTKLGFESFSLISTAAGLPRWAQGHGSPEVAAEAQSALAAGRSVRDFYERLMVLDLRGT
ncbi:MAG: hypothetical protein JXA21_24540 [Anaerolineae bacterium]|nr:hypothetical protein [Anaerolineae bacterium]